MHQRRLVALVLVLLGLSPAVGAQVLQPPERGLDGRRPAADADRTQQELVFDLDLLGGYEDNLVPPLQGALLGSTRPSGYQAFTDATLRYRLGQQARALDISGRGYMTSYEGLGDGPSYGGELNMAAQSTLGRRASVAASHRTSYDPFFTVGAFAPIQAAAGPRVFDANTINALAEQRSWSSASTASWSHQWARRTSTRMSYAFAKRADVEHISFDSHSQTGSLSLDQSLGRYLGMTASYSYGAGLFVPPGQRELDFNNQNVAAGLNFSRDLSRTRRVSLTAGAGAAQVDTLHGITLEPLHYRWTPTGYASARLDFRRSWSAAVDYRSSASVLQGVIPNITTVNAVGLQVGGFVTGRLESVLNAGYSAGRVGAGAVGTGRYESYTATAQLRLQLARSLSAMVSYSRFDYWMNDAGGRALGILWDVERSAVRVGLVWSVPIVGSRAARPAPGAD